eukprot:CAMPEP_0170735608 /NCGR_PEP_ID=MMETSP0437-20130122/3184_1 /TAXON_ID=0 /ORGANISM="Sexangularia sp." /LENGTH=2393 /DNA_ID=CAMNT_0011073939 /DNA_START=304 /DNA_END=7485 /DNA_ORIENTATION=-
MTVDREAYLGTLGPTIRVVEGDRVNVHLRNRCSFPVSLHTHGLFYYKDAEGAIYNDGVVDKENGRVEPGARGLYRWFARGAGAPGPDSPSSVAWPYHSHVDEIGDVAAGLVGFVLWTRREDALPDGRPADVDREVVVLASLNDERASPLWPSSVAAALGGDGASVDDDSDADIMHSLNGQMYGAGAPIEVVAGERVRLHAMVMGSEADVHPLFLDNHTFTVHHTSVGHLGVLAADTTTATTVVRAGSWRSCGLDDHVDAGMWMTMEVRDGGDDASLGAVDESRPLTEVFIALVQENYTLPSLAEIAAANAAASPLGARLSSVPDHLVAVAGSTIERSVLRAYTDATFTTPLPHDRSTLGLLGQTLYCPDGGRLRVHYLQDSDPLLSGDLIIFDLPGRSVGPSTVEYDCIAETASTFQYGVGDRTSAQEGAAGFLVIGGPSPGPEVALHFSMMTDGDVAYAAVNLVHPATLTGLSFSANAASGQLIVAAAGATDSIHGISFYDAPVSSIFLVPGYSTIVTLPTTGLGLITIACRTSEHMTDSMIVSVRVGPASAPAVSEPIVQSVFLRVTVGDWDYTPAGGDLVNMGAHHVGTSFDEDQRVFTSDFVGSVYRKAQFVEYTDDTFTTIVPAPPGNGFLGPTLILCASRSSLVPVRLVVSLADDVPFNVTLVLPGVLLFDQLLEVTPSSRVAEVTAWLAPTDGLVSHVYSGAIDGSLVVGEMTGLAGFVAIGPDAADPTADDQVTDTCAELRAFPPTVAMLTVTDESLSYFAADNAARAGVDPAALSSDDRDHYEESNLMHGTNGFLYGNGGSSMFSINVTDAPGVDTVMWIVGSVGALVDVHTMHWHGTTLSLVEDGTTVDVVSTTAGTSALARMDVANAGTHLWHCHVADHISAGMTGTFTIVNDRPVDAVDYGADESYARGNNIFHRDWGLPGTRFLGAFEAGHELGDVADVNMSEVEALYTHHFFSGSEGTGRFARVGSAAGLSMLHTMFASLIADDVARMAPDDPRTLGSSAFLDLSPLYGETRAQRAAARNGTQVRSPVALIAAGQPTAMRFSSALSLAVADLFASEHNMRAANLSAGTANSWAGTPLDSGADEETVFAEARAWTIALWQSLVTRDWLAAATGEALSPYVPLSVNESGASAGYYAGSVFDPDEPVAVTGSLALLVLPLLVMMTSSPSMVLLDPSDHQVHGTDDVMPFQTCVLPTFGEVHPCLRRGTGPLALGAIVTGTTAASGTVLPYATFLSAPWPASLPVGMQMMSLARLTHAVGVAADDDPLVQLLTGSSVLTDDGKRLGHGHMAPAMAAEVQSNVRRLRAGDARWYERGAATTLVNEIHGQSAGLLVRRHVDTNASIPTHAFYSPQLFAVQLEDAFFPAMPDYVDGEVTLSPSFHLGWSIDGDRLRIVLQVATSGYVGIGFSPAQPNTMKGADIILCSSVGPDGATLDGIACFDAYAEDVGAPRPDREYGGADDAVLSSASVVGGVTIVELSRPLAATDGDLLDAPINLGGETEVIFAYSDTHDHLYHGPRRSSSRFVDFSLPYAESDGSLTAGEIAAIVIGALCYLLSGIALITYFTTRRVQSHGATNMLSMRVQTVQDLMDLDALDTQEARDAFRLPLIAFNSTNVRGAKKRRLGEWPLSVSKSSLDFALKTALVPVDTVIEDTVTVTNTSKARASFTLCVPPYQDATMLTVTSPDDATAQRTVLSHGGRYLLTCVPKEGQLAPGQSTEVRVRLKVLCTTRISGMVAFSCNGLKSTAPPMHYPVRFTVESEVSPFLDFAELVLEEKIGIGSFGLVFAGRWRRQKVAIKVLLQQEFLQDWQLREFENEVEVLEQLRHKNIVRFVGACMQPNRLSMVTELCTIGSLKEVLKEFALPWDLTVRLCLDTAIGLLFLHETGLLHQDIKPGNVLVAALSADAPVVAKLTDFGSTGRAVVETKGRFQPMGTPIYTAPELDGRTAPSEAADAYSYAIMCFEIITQSDPYPDVELTWDIATHVRNGNRPVFPREVADSAPPGLLKMITDAWAPAPTDRPTMAAIVPMVVDAFRELGMEHLHSHWLAETTVATQKLEIDIGRLARDDAYRKEGLRTTSQGDGSTGRDGSTSKSMPKPATGSALRITETPPKVGPRVEEPSRRRRQSNGSSGSSTPPRRKTSFPSASASRKGSSAYSGSELMAAAAAALNLSRGPTRKGSHQHHENTHLRMAGEDDALLSTLSSENEALFAAASRERARPPVPDDPGSGESLERSLSIINARILATAAANMGGDEEVGEGLIISKSTFAVSERKMSGPATLRRGNAVTVDPAEAELLVRVAGSTVRLVRALVDHHASSPAELTFFVGEAFSASPTTNEAIWRGMHKGKTGLFPISAVEIVHDEALSTAKDRGKSRRAKKKASKKL